MMWEFADWGFQQGLLRNFQTLQLMEHVDYDVIAVLKDLRICGSSYQCKDWVKLSDSEEYAYQP
jgi:hypothetical protein